MPLPEEVHRRLAARAVTDPDVASLLAIVTKTRGECGRTRARADDRGERRARTLRGVV